MGRNRFAFLAIFATVISLMALGGGSARAATYTTFFQGFEVDNSGWPTAPTRVASGTNGVTSRTGAYHAEAAQNSGIFTRWGGYNSAFPAGGYTTSIDIYLNPSNITVNDLRFDWDSAISNSSGGF